MEKYEPIDFDHILVYDYTDKHIAFQYDSSILSKYHEECIYTFGNLYYFKYDEILLFELSMRSIRGKFLA